MKSAKQLGFLFIGLSFLFLPFGGNSQEPLTKDTEPKTEAAQLKIAMQPTADPTLEEAIDALRGGDISATSYVYEGLLALFTFLSGLLLKWFNIKWQLPSIALPLVVVAIISIGVVVSLGLANALPALLSVLSTSGIFGLLKGINKFTKPTETTNDKLQSLERQTLELKQSLGIA